MKNGMTKYVIEVSVIAECADDADAEAVGAAVVQKLTGNTPLSPADRANIRRVEEATVANVDGEFLSAVRPARTGSALR